MTELSTILVVDDEPRSQEALRRTLDEDFNVLTASGAAEALALMEDHRVHVVLTDQRMPGMSGVAFLRQVREAWPDTVRIIISGYTDSEDIIAGINEAGIYQYLLKPWHPDQLLLTLRRAAELQRLETENHRLTLELRAAEPHLRGRVGENRARLRQAFAPDAIVRAADSPMQAVCQLVERAANYDVPVLIEGESGTGKELLARAIHYGGGRAEQPFVVENCGALPDTLLESELFGHKKGAYTGASQDRVGLFQQAHGGTLFLDEIGETSAAFQVKLLRVLQEGEFRPLGSSRTVAVDVRVVAATNRHLEDEVRAGRFREDLYYRLATVPVRVPALRERPMDIPELARRILAKVSANLGRRVDGFAPEVLACMQAYAWPGNVRELQNEIQRMLVVSDRALLDLDALALAIRQQASLAGLRPPRDEAGTPAGGRLDAMEARLLCEALRKHDGNLTHAASELGLSRPGLRAKLRRLGVSVPVRGRGRPARTLGREDG
ncbi:sigma-54-dependent transcriptional regulator [Parasulfuritortus cantonensis]|uniref:sigma-54-dependent transcriptional regulator n=1 Tax=Parasulfuritortus cantonensis TaxID=2528202 RepID=UPI001F0F1E40|nr:sigma-54 dependent transcriptional regulator [Parasulfuritortus cantonensis]